MNKWEGAVAVVTGASAGIGKAISIKLAEHGLRVAALARREDKLKELSRNFNGKGEIRGFVCDVTDEGKLDEVFAKIESEMGLIRVLVNNAGVALYNSLTDFDLEKWRKIFDVNVFGMFSCIKRLVNSMKKKKRGLVHIINMNSLCGHYQLDNPSVAVYTASKHCVTYLNRQLMLQLTKEKHNIKVTSVSPGAVDTEIFDVGEWDKEALLGCPYLQPEDIANATVSILKTEEDVLITELIIKPKGQVIL